MQKLTKLEGHNLAIRGKDKFEDKEKICRARQSLDNLYCPFECKRCEKLIEKERQKLIVLQMEYKKKWGEEYN